MIQDLLCEDLIVVNFGPWNVLDDSEVSFAFIVLWNGSNVLVTLVKETSRVSGKQTHFPGEYHVLPCTCCAFSHKKNMFPLKPSFLLRTVEKQTFKKTLSMGSCLLMFAIFINMYIYIYYIYIYITGSKKKTNQKSVHSIPAYLCCLKA